MSIKEYLSAYTSTVIIIIFEERVNQIKYLGDSAVIDLKF